MAQLKEGSVIKKVGGDEVIATIDDIDKTNTDLGSHLADEAKHITSAERDAWNSMQDALEQEKTVIGKVKPTNATMWYQEL